VSTNNKFNSTINSLRGLSILSVLFFHIEISLFKGGFIGVDVFFVISGYLISKSIIPEIENNKFHFKEYLIRRLRRVLPSYFLIVLVSFIIISLIFIETHYYYSLKETFYSFFLFQNFYYWDQSGYFGLENLYKPLLNTWSLAIEFQFYFLYPIIFWIFRNKIILLIIFSLILSIIFLDRNFSYFLLPTRFFEFGVGIIVFYFERISKVNFSPKKSNFFFIFGIILILISICYLDGEKPFPGFYALIPCFGAGLLIFFSRTANNRILIDNRFLNFFGNISYSLYLIHWPLIIFYKYNLLKINLNLFDQLLITFSSIFLAYLNTYYFEIFFYKIKKSNKVLSFKKISIIYTIFFIFISSLYLKTYTLKSNSVENLQTNLLVNSNEEETELIFKDNKFGKILIIGNSHGLELFRSLISNKFYKENFQIKYIEFGDDCYDIFTSRDNYLKKIEISISKIFNFGTQQNCTNNMLELENSGLLKSADTIILANRYRKSSIKNISFFIKKIQNENNKIILINNNPRFIDPPTLIELNKSLTPDEINKKFYKYQDMKIKNLNKILQKISETEKITYYNKYNLICNQVTKSCEVVSKNGKLLFFDLDHLNKKGQKKLGTKLFNSNFHNLF
jgi:peptidoglycan/LPS O-acetylase OafA/YrhL